MTQPEHEHFPDPIDRASELEGQTRDAAIQAIQRRNVQKQKPDANGNYPEPDCEECGDEIPIERLKVATNNTLCIVCARLAERWKR